MKVTVIGANGKTGRLVVGRLANSGHEVRAMVRAEEQLAGFAGPGVTAILGDLEGEFRPALEGAEAVIFAAGSGSATGADKTLLVDLLGATRSIDACVDLGVSRYVMLSGQRAGDPYSGGPQIRHYLAAKHAADRLLAGSPLAFTIVRPGRLTDEEPTGRVRLGQHLDRGTVTRGDVAAVLAACLDIPATVGTTFEMVEGEVPIADALRSVTQP